MEHFFDLFEATYSDVSLLAITPTTYPMQQSSFTDSWLELVFYPLPKGIVFDCDGVIFDSNANEM